MPNWLIMRKVSAWVVGANNALTKLTCRRSFFIAHANKTNYKTSVKLFDLMCWYVRLLVLSSRFTPLKWFVMIRCSRVLAVPYGFNCITSHSTHFVWNKFSLIMLNLASSEWMLTLSLSQSRAWQSIRNSMHMFIVVLAINLGHMIDRFTKAFS